jgi:hypothetical protein
MLERLPSNEEEQNLQAMSNFPKRSETLSIGITFDADSICSFLAKSHEYGNLHKSFPLFSTAAHDLSTNSWIALLRSDNSSPHATVQPGIKYVA